MARTKSNDKGFSLIEMMVSLLLLLVVSGVAFYALRYYQQNYGSTRLRAAMHEGVRGVVELMTQEIGQAGLLTFTPRTMTTATVVSAAPQTVTLSSVDSVFAGESLVVDADTNEERVTVISVDTGTSTITAVFEVAHAANSMVRAVGVFPLGVLNTSTTNELRLFGDINNDGKLVYLKYVCNTANGRLTRSVTTWTPAAATAAAAETLLDNLIPSPGVTDCFQYQFTCTKALSPCPAPDKLVTSVGITLSVRTSTVDPQTRQFATMTKSFLNLSPRNILNALNLARSGNSSRLQNLPSNIPLT